MSALIDPPYPSDLEAKGWSLDLDYEKIEQSDTWAIASAEQRPWLLMLWLVSWRQSPVASLPQDDRLISARIGLPLDRFVDWKEVLLAGWEPATDGRLYHKTLTKHALRMAEKRSKDRQRVAEFRKKSQDVASCNALQARDQHVSSTPTPTPTPTPTEAKAKDSAPSARGVRLPADWALPADWRQWAEAERSDVEPEAEAAKFADYWRSQPGAKGRKTDWLATWRNWIRNADTRRNARAGPVSDKPSAAADFRGKIYESTPDHLLPVGLR